MGLVNSFKRDIARHRQKAAVLAVLLGVMLFMSVRAALQLRPTPVAAATEILATEQEPAANSANESVEAEDRIRLSTELWRQLNKKGGMDVAVAFKFDPSIYPLDPARATVAQIPVDPVEPEPVKIRAED